MNNQMLQGFLAAFNQIPPEKKSQIINNLKESNRLKNILEAKKLIKFDLKFSKIYVYEYSDDVKKFIKIIKELNMKSIEVIEELR